MASREATATRRVNEERRAALSAQLDAIEAEMRQIGYWVADPPDLIKDYDSGARRTYLDAPTFELWLQAVFLLRAREAVRTGNLPRASDVGGIAMRQYDYHSFVPEAQDLLRLLHEFDRLVVQPD